nr:hypothetical protein Q903MT_gene4718 [Picea sitchensis]
MEKLSSYRTNRCPSPNRSRALLPRREGGIFFYSQEDLSICLPSQYPCSTGFLSFIHLIGRGPSLALLVTQAILW